MKNAKYISIFSIAIFFIIFAMFNLIRTKKYCIIKIVTPYEIYIDTNNNGLADDDEKYNFLNEYQVLTKENISDKYWETLKLDEETLTTLAYLSEKYVNEVLTDKKVSLKKVRHNKELYISGERYIDILAKSGYLFINGKPINQSAFNIRLEQIKKNDYKIYNTKSNKYHLVTCKYGKAAHNYVILSKYQLPKGASPCKYCINKKSHVKTKVSKAPNFIFNDGTIKVILSDYTNHLVPNRRGEGKICTELIKLIDSAQSSIDIAIYGYDRVPKIEKALKRAMDRGVKVRLVYDTDSKGNNIYANTDYFSKFIPNSVCDNPIDTLKDKAGYSNSIMHNKFYIFDMKTVLTGSANLSYTDMSDFNANSVVIINSKEIAKIYTKEFEQMYNNKFHYIKSKISDKRDFSIQNTSVSIFFSPKDNIITSKILPLINNAQKYIYMPIFVITDKNLAQALIMAKKRGVDVKLIVDATNAVNTYSKHNLLRQNKIQVKTENYAGKLHSKSIIIDDKYTVIGSMNFSKNGELKNDENVVIIKNKQAALFYKAFFKYLWSKIDDYCLTHDVSSESRLSIGSCSDGIDNDYDGKTDMEDEGCRFIPKKLK